MTIRDLLHDLNTQTIPAVGLDAEVKVWFLGHEPLHTLAEAGTTSVSAGQDNETKRPIALIKITP